MTSDERVARVTRRATANRVVIDDLTPSANAARSDAWIPAFLIAASFVSSAVRIDDAFRSTGRRHSSIAGQAGADGLPVDWTALAVRTARGRLARRSLDGSGDWVTLYEGIAGHTRRARANWDVIDNVAASVLTAGPWARISTLVPDASFVPWAIVVEYAFRPAARVRVALVLGKTGTDPVGTLSVGTTRGRVARISLLRFWWWWRLGEAVGEWIAGKTFWAHTDRSVVDDVAICAGSARPWARVATLLPHAGENAWALGVDATLGSTVWR